MAAHVIVATQEQWSFLRNVGEGAIIVAPDAAKQFREKHGCGLPDWIEYDYVRTDNASWSLEGVSSAIPSPR